MSPAQQASLSHSAPYPAHGPLLVVDVLASRVMDVVVVLVDGVLDVVVDVLPESVGEVACEVAVDAPGEVAVDPPCEGVAPLDDVVDPALEGALLRELDVETWLESLVEPDPESEVEPATALAVDV